MSAPAPAPATEKKSINTATIASIIFPGLGQFYNGQTNKGILFVIIGAILWYGIVATHRFLYGVSIVVYVVIWAYNIYDARNTAKFINEGAT